MTTQDKAATGPARTRYAPSPTGNPHIGNIRTALFDYLWAKHTGGQFVLRLEDTDRKRLNEESLGYIKNSLQWLGLDWDEGPDVGGPYAPYVQSERLENYQTIAQELIDRGFAYRCYCSRERLDAVNKAKQAQELPPGYDRRCRSISQAEIDEALGQGIQPIIRFKVPLEGKTTVVDSVVKPLTVENSTIEDYVLIKSDGYPTYHLAHLVDDRAMQITHVIRGQEWLPTAPLHIMIHEALGWEPPIYVHVPVILNPPGQKGKLSKRDNAVAVSQYQQLGYLPEALLNFLVLLGWSFDGSTEFFTKDELIEKFDIARIQPTPAKFNLDKLDFLNAHYINHVLTPPDFAARCLPFLVESGVISAETATAPADKQLLIVAACNLVKDKVKTLGEVPGEIDFIFKPAESLDYPTTDLIGKLGGHDAAIRVLDAANAFIKEASDETLHDREALLDGLTKVSEDLGLANRGLMFWPPRVALSGRTKSPDLMGMIVTLGREETRHRLQLARHKLAELN